MTQEERATQIRQYVEENKNRAGVTYRALLDTPELTIYTETVERDDVLRINFLSSTHWSSAPIQVRYGSRWADEFVTDLSWSSGGTVTIDPEVLARGMALMYTEAERIIRNIKKATS